MTATRAITAGFVAIHLRARDGEEAERAVAESVAAGATGAEERDDENGLRIVLYAPADRVDAVWRAAVATGATPVAREPVPSIDWSEHWKQSLQPVEISAQLCIRPSFCSVPTRPGRHVVVIDPGQAFGTGGHESTRLLLEWIDELAPSLESEVRLLDVGTGSGVLSLAALGLAPIRAVGFDLDPLAGEAARDNARANGLSDRLDVFVGGVDALAPGARFALVLANLLRRELEPILPALSSHLAPEGALLLAGLLDSEREGIVRRCAGLGLAEAGARERRDASGETWVSLLMRPRPVATRSGDPA